MEAKNVDGTESTSRWFQINQFSRVTKCGSLREIEHGHFTLAQTNKHNNLRIGILNEQSYKD